MGIKILTGVIGGTIMVVLIASDKIIVNICIAVASFIALTEIYTAVGLNKNISLMSLGLLTSVAFTFDWLVETGYLSLMLFAYVFILLLYYMGYHKSLSFSDISKMFFITIFVCFFFANVGFVRKLELGEYYIWFVFIGAWVTDAAAYLSGTFLGRHKLWKSLSPKKTIEGAIGGIIIVSLVFCGMAYLMQMKYGFNMNYYLIAAFGIVCGVFAELGDLAASAIKREHNIKDFGNVFPGHGGFMDRCDSLLLVAPAAYWFLLYLGPVMFGKI